MSDGDVGIALAMLSAIMTAVAHALLKSGKDKLAVRALVGAVCAIIMAPVCLVVPLPTAGMVPWLLLSALLHTIYQLVLIRSYTAADFGVAFPIARGMAPLATAILGIALLADRITAAGLFGIGLVSGGILLIAAGRSIAFTGLLWAGIAGLLTTAYTLVDARAVRLAPEALTFVSWFFVLDGLIMFPIFMIARWGRVRPLLRSEGRQGLIAGITSLVSFGSTLFALRLAPVGIVSALRETSVIFAVAIAGVFLREHVDRRKAVGAIAVAAGAVTIVSKGL
jgi:drug/metabolite transporter (DMT)-like permease